jgi:hypothetical protein
MNSRRRIRDLLRWIKATYPGLGCVGTGYTASQGGAALGFGDGPPGMTLSRFKLDFCRASGVTSFESHARQTNGRTGDGLRVTVRADGRGGVSILPNNRWRRWRRTTAQ